MQLHHAHTAVAHVHATASTEESLSAHPWKASAAATTMGQMRSSPLPATTGGLTTALAPAVLVLAAFSPSSAAGFFFFFFFFTFVHFVGATSRP
jgi:hypothetical protein